LLAYYKYFSKTSAVYLPHDAGLTLGKKFSHSNLGSFTLIHIQNSLNVKPDIPSESVGFNLIKSFAYQEFNLYKFFKGSIAKPTPYWDRLADVD